MSTYSRLLALVAASGALLMPGEAIRAQLLITGNDEKVSFDEKTWSTRAFPKFSRMVCSGLLNTCAIPLKSGAFAGGVIQRFNSGCTLGTALAREARSGTKATDVW